MSHRPRRQLLTLALALAAALACTAVSASLAAPSPAAGGGVAEVAPPPDLPRHPLAQLPEQPTKGERAARVALRAIGIPYRWGGESPASGFDCSGLVRWAYARVGIDLPHSSYALYGEGRRVRRSGMEAGDLLFFEGLGHVGLYVGKGRMVHAPQTGRHVEVVQLAGSNYGRRLIGARRIVRA